MSGENGAEIDLSRLIDDGQWGSFQKSVLALVSLAFIVDSLANNVLSIAIPAITRDWHVTRAMFSPISAIGWVGVAFGTIVAGSLADRFGRKSMLLASILIFGIATAGCALTRDMHQLLLLRILDGFGIGGAIPTAVTLLSEFTPARRSSRAVIAGMVCIPIGNFVGGMIGSLILPHYGWRVLFLINGALAISVCALILCFIPESPRFLVRQPHRSLELLRGLKQLKIEVPVGVKWIDSRLLSRSSPLSALFEPQTLLMTLSLWGGYFFCFLAAYTSLSWMPSLLSSHGYSLGISSLALSASGVGGIIGSVITAKIIEQYGSRATLIFAVLVAILSTAALSLIPLNSGQSAVPALVAIGFIGLAINSLTGFVYALAAHVYPPTIKGTGLGAAGAVGRMGALVSAYAGVAMLTIGSTAYLGFIALSVLISSGCLFTIKRLIPNDRTFSSSKDGVRG